MPSPRPKSCEQCRRAKLRCNLLTPCTRCTKRGLDCRYTFTDRSRGPQRPRPLRPAISNDKDIVSHEETETCSTGQAEDGTACFGPNEQTRSDHGAALISVAAVYQPMPGMEIPSDFMPDLFELPDSFDLPPFSFDFDLTSMEHLPALSTDTQLEPRSRSFQQGALTAKMLFSKLASYSRIMADARRLPPFIVPSCWSSGTGKCEAASPHRCLPEPLAVCSNLAQMFYLRRDGSEGFVWQQICAHLKQLREKCHGSTDEEALHALQATLVYGILCSTCVGSVSRSDADWVVASIEMLGRKAFSACTWALSSHHVCSSRQEWTLIESLRRIGCTLYLFDLLISSTARTPSKGNCDTFWFMPLPCGRALWDPMADAEWSNLYQQDLNARKQKGWQGLTLRHLLLLRHAKITGDSVGFADELADWCERVDDLSTLLWLALTVEGDGQSVMTT